MKSPRSKGRYYVNESRKSCEADKVSQLDASFCVQHHTTLIKSIPSILAIFKALRKKLRNFFYWFEMSKLSGRDSDISGSVDVSTQLAS